MEEKSDKIIEPLTKIACLCHNCNYGWLSDYFVGKWGRLVVGTVGIVDQKTAVVMTIVQCV